MKILPGREFKIKITTKSDGKSLWYKEGETFIATFSDLYIDTYEVIEPLYAKGKFILQVHAEVDAFIDG